MPIDEIFKKATANDVISELKSCRFIPQPDVERAEKALNPKLHDINDPVIRKDKRVKIDADGNYAPKCTILRYTGHRVSWGQTSTVVNYTIAHIWAKTDNPLFFNSLWNYALLPTHCAFITDKRDDSHPLVKRVKDLIRAISWELYDPNRIMDWNQKVVTDEEKPSAQARNEAKRLIKEGKIQFLPKNEIPVNDQEIPSEDESVDVDND